MNSKGKRKFLRLRSGQAPRQSSGKSGLTLIEMIVSISIIVLLTTLFLANYRSGQRSSELSLAAQKLASDIRLAQNYSLGAKEFNGSVPQGGWCIYINNSSNYKTLYVLGADYLAGGNKQCNVWASPSSELFKQVDLPSGITIDQIVAHKNSDSTNYYINGTIDIVFIPPDPTTSIRDRVPYDYVDVSITLKDQNNNTKKVKVNFLGMIDVD